MNNIDDDIIPYCVWHYIDINTNTFLGYISAPKKHKKNGFVSFNCESKIKENWVLAGTFYGIAPNFRPIPVGMKIFCIKNSSSFPYNTKDIQSLMNEACGWYCLACDYALEHKQNGNSYLEDFEKFIALWSDEPRDNLTILKAFFKPL
jgi:hypothetical protein